MIPKSENICEISSPIVRNQLHCERNKELHMKLDAKQHLANIKAKIIDEEITSICQLRVNLCLQSFLSVNF